MAEHRDERNGPSSAGRGDRPAADPGSNGRKHTRQVLVVGDGPVGLVTAGFLDQAGLEPVVVPAPDTTRREGVTAIWEPGLALLERLGLRRPVRRHGTPVTELERPERRQVRQADPGGRQPLVAVSWPTLRRLVRRRLAPALTTVPRAPTTVTATETGTRVTFESGVIEAFDAVVSTTRSLGAVPDRVTGVSRLDVWTFRWPTGTPAPGCATEAWTDSLAAFTLPAPDGPGVVLVSAERPPATTAVTPEELTELFGPLFASSASPFDGLAQGAIRYERPPRATPRSRYTDAVVFVGPATRAPIPGDCLSLTLGIEDGWVLADALAYGPQTQSAAVEAYQARRRQRAAELFSGIPDDLSEPPGQAHPLADLAARRWIALGHLFGLPDHAVEKPVTRIL
jgi:2-polyprenyl-6-methoxyphenol hydroxylase-like FAD-dependent oxidoreductase